MTMIIKWSASSFNASDDGLTLSLLEVPNGTYRILLCVTPETFTRQWGIETLGSERIDAENVRFLITF